MGGKIHSKTQGRPGKSTYDGVKKKNTSTNKNIISQNQRKSHHVCDVYSAAEGLRERLSNSVGLKPSKTRVSLTG